MKKTLIASLILATFSFSAQAATHTKSAASKAKTQQVAPVQVVDQSAALMLEIKKRYPNTAVDYIRPSGIDGIYEIAMGKNIAYSDAKLTYFLFGHLFDMQTQRDVTQDRIDEASRINFSALPLDKAIKVVKGKGERVFAVFTDPDCPYCKKLEENLAGMDNYTMYVFMFPIPQLHPAAVDHANGIWCSTDRNAAWSKSMATGEFPVADANCKTPTEDVARLAQSLGVQGTPTIFRLDGKRQGGAMPAEALSQWLNAN